MKKPLKDKDWLRVVRRLCRKHGLTMERGTKGLKLYKDGRMVASIHNSVSDSYRAIMNFEHELEGRL